MSNKPNRTTSQRHSVTHAAATAKERRSTTPIIIGVVVAAVLVIGLIVAVLVGGGDDDDSATLADAEVYQPVEVTGTPLPEYDKDDPALGISDVVPVLSGFDYEGTPITIDAATDGPTMVVVLAHWCPHCNAEIPVLNEWRDSGDVPEGLDVVGVSTVVRSDGDHYPPGEWLVEMDWQWPVLADDEDGTALSALGVSGFPTLLLIDSDGELVWRGSGEYPVEAIQAAVDDLMAAESS